ncbi:hypothetical protein IOCL2690_000787400 [Leishmania lindenbergi]|uniref:Uncharacterized protein n=1 Tax=Leishmania lindenbergi TaxID=651832 RepID=A0AAW2ZYR6_9TRYP
MGRPCLQRLRETYGMHARRRDSEGPDLGLAGSLLGLLRHAPDEGTGNEKASPLDAWPDGAAGRFLPSGRDLAVAKWLASCDCMRTAVDVFAAEWDAETGRRTG